MTEKKAKKKKKKKERKKKRERERKTQQDQMTLKATGWTWVRCTVELLHRKSCHKGNK